MKRLELLTREDMLAAFQQSPEVAIAILEAQNAVIEQLVARLQVLEDQINKNSHNPSFARADLYS